MYLWVNNHTLSIEKQLPSEQTTINHKDYAREQLVHKYETT